MNLTDLQGWDEDLKISSIVGKKGIFPILTIAASEDKQAQLINFLQKLAESSKGSPIIIISENNLPEIFKYPELQSSRKTFTESVNIPPLYTKKYRWR